MSYDIIKTIWYIFFLISDKDLGTASVQVDLISPILKASRLLLSNLSKTLEKTSFSKLNKSKTNNFQKNENHDGLVKTNQIKNKQNELVLNEILCQLKVSLSVEIDNFLNNSQTFKQNT